MSKEKERTGQEESADIFINRMAQSAQMSSEERAAVKRMSGAVPSNLWGGHECDELLLLRFLRYNTGEEEAAKDAAIDYLSWKRQFHVDHIGIDDVAEFLQRDLLTVTDCKDRLGRPLVVLRWCNFQPAEIEEREMLQAFAYMFERLLEITPPVFEFCAVLDYGDWSLRQTSPRLAKLSLDLAKRYPFIPHSYAVNVPWYFRAVWKVVRPWMTQAAVDKFQVMASSELEEKIDRENRLPSFGGTSKFNVADWIAGRKTAEAGKKKRPSEEESFVAAMSKLTVSADDVDSDAVKSGFLQKQGSGGYFGTTAWKARYFVISRGSLYYYTERGADKPNRVYDLATCSIEVPNEPGQKSDLFYLVSGGRKMPLAAESKDDLADWVDTLKAQCQKASAQ